mmetsp:Transcript_63231/g.206343  ORF Transcript_63231/g.206343 Transcript_63231/m.206343 type:complete len:117 (+) Transcript_63231:1115-1465(+)
MWCALQGPSSATSSLGRTLFFDADEVHQAIAETGISSSWTPRQSENRSHHWQQDEICEKDHEQRTSRGRCNVEQIWLSIKLRDPWCVASEAAHGNQIKAQSACAIAKPSPFSTQSC